MYGLMHLGIALVYIALVGWLIYKVKRWSRRAAIAVVATPTHTYYKDLGSSQYVQAGLLGNLRNVRFGDGAANSLNGGTQDDALFGDAGNTRTKRDEVVTC